MLKAVFCRRDRPFKMRPDLMFLFSSILLSGLFTAENKKYYQRLQEYISLSTQKTNDYFHTRGGFSRDPKKLYNELKIHEEKIIELRKQKKLNRNQFDTIFPPGGTETFSDRFDLSLLRVLIANLIKTGKSFKFWISNDLPSPKDMSVEAGIEKPIT